MGETQKQAWRLDAFVQSYKKYAQYTFSFPKQVVKSIQISFQIRNKTNKQTKQHDLCLTYCWCNTEFKCLAHWKPSISIYCWQDHLGRLGLWLELDWYSIWIDQCHQPIWVFHRYSDIWVYVCRYEKDLYLPLQKKHFPHWSSIH